MFFQTSFPIRLDIYYIYPLAYREKKMQLVVKDIFLLIHSSFLTSSLAIHLPIYKIPFLTYPFVLLHSSERAMENETYLSKYDT